MSSSPPGSDDAPMIVDGARDAPFTLMLAHGAGAPMDHPFMNAIAQGVARKGLRVVRFEFPYMAARRISGKRRAPDRETVLMQTWRNVVARIGKAAGLVVGGKSMGGRIASMIADEVGAAGLICLGYPFHPPGDPARIRVKHLEKLRTPTLILQGTRDSFGRPDEVARYSLSPRIRVFWIGDGDHSFKPRASSGRTEGQNLSVAIEEMIGFIDSLKTEAGAG